MDVGVDMKLIFAVQYVGNIYTKPFILRNYYWKDHKPFMEKHVIIPTLEKIVEVKGKEYLEPYEIKLLNRKGEYYAKG